MEVILKYTPTVFVLEYYLDTLWKGTLLFVICLLLVSLDILRQVCSSSPIPGIAVPLPPPLPSFTVCLSDPCYQRLHRQRSR